MRGQENVQTSICSHSAGGNLVPRPPIWKSSRPAAAAEAWPLGLLPLSSQSESSAERGEPGPANLRSRFQPVKGGLSSRPSL